jgi:hypothetical protein
MTETGRHREIIPAEAGGTGRGDPQIDIFIPMGIYGSEESSKGLHENFTLDLWLILQKL